MNCDSLQRLLLALERPDCPPADARGHLAGCPVCRTWLRKLVRTEQQAASLPVPPPRRKEAFLEQWLGASGEWREPRRCSRTSPLALRPAPDKRERGLRKMALAVALAAALVFVALGVWAWQRGGPVSPGRPASPLQASPLEERLKGDTRWAQARTPPDRLQVLSELAREAQGRALVLARAGGRQPGEDLDRQVRLFRETVQRIKTEAPQVAPQDRERVLRPIALQLARIESDAERLAADSPAAAVSLRELAAAAREGDRQLRGLLQNLSGRPA